MLPRALAGLGSSLRDAATIAGTQADEATLTRMRQIAAALGAGLQSSDGQFGESPGTVARGGLPGRR